MGVRDRRRSEVRVFIQLGKLKELLVKRVEPKRVMSVEL